nr:MAG TPA: hypothetical protein [Caudoviricetes sp.]
MGFNDFLLTFGHSNLYLVVILFHVFGDCFLLSFRNCHLPTSLVGIVPQYYIGDNIQYRHIGYDIFVHYYILIYRTRYITIKQVKGNKRKQFRHRQKMGEERL